MEHRLVLVFARSHEQFRNWCYEHMIPPTLRNLRFISDEQHVRGYAPGTPALFLDGWEYNKNYSTDFYIIVESRDFRTVTSEEAIKIVKGK